MPQQRKYATGAERQAAYRERQKRTKRNSEALRLGGETVNLQSPPVRYFGAKWRIASWVIEQFPPHVTYVEPFCGAANILFRKPVSKVEVINDLNNAVVTFFDVLRSRPDDLLNAIELTPYARAEHKRAHEDVPLHLADRELEIARRFYVRSRQSYGSGEGEYNTGWRFQKDDARRLSVNDEWNNLENLKLAARRLKSVQIECTDALECIDRFDTPDTLFYCDPPYLFETRWSDEERYAHEMSNDDHIRLAEKLKSVRGMVLISGYPSSLYSELYAGWRCIQKETKTNGNHNATEALWISPHADDVNHLPLFKTV